MSDVTGLMQPGSVAMLVSAAVFLLVLLVLKTMLAQGAIRRRVGAPLAPTVRSPIETAEVSEQRILAVIARPIVALHRCSLHRRAVPHPKLH